MPHVQPVTPPPFTQEEKLDLALFLLVQQQQAINLLQGNVAEIMSEQTDFNTDISALTADLGAVLPFVAALPGQLTAIQAALAEQGITDITSLDNLVTQANGVTGNVSSLQNTLSSMPGGTSATTTPPTTPTTPVTPTS
jgi:hypothetical protein